MQKEAYELLALFMRYWFVFLMAFIVIRAVRWLYIERKAYIQTLRYLPDAGFIGEVAVGQKAYPLPREGAIGAHLHADIRIPELKRARFYFELAEGEGVLVLPNRHARRATLDGRALSRSAHALHDSYLQLGDITLRFRLFEGLNVPKRPLAYAAYEGDADITTAADAWGDAVPDGWVMPGQAVQPPQTSPDPWMADTREVVPYGQEGGARCETPDEGSF